MKDAVDMGELRACFVITAHGFGHASRQMEVIRVVLARDPEAQVVVLTAAPEAIFRNYLGPAEASGERLTIVVPITIFTIFFLLYLNTGSGVKAGIVMLAGSHRARPARRGPRGGPR